MEESTGEFTNGPIVIKKKRSKRPRPYSPTFTTAVTTTVVPQQPITSSYSTDENGGTDNGGSGGGGSNCLSIDQYSPNSFSTDDSETTEFQEELADCLLLLSRGFNPIDELDKPNHRSTDNMATTTTTTTSAAVKDEYVVYECKTCYRTFPSFQALGGHRTSHKKPKLSTEENTERSLVLLPPLIDAEDDDEVPVPLQMISVKGKEKLHACSICRKEFSSGQALGGHMRRHRNMMLKPPPTAASIQTSQIVTSSNEDVVVDNGRNNSFMFDLNLPAPVENDQMDFNYELFDIASTSRQIVSLPRLF